MNRCEVREKLSNAGININSITDQDLLLLRRILSKHLRRSGIYYGTAKLVRIKKDLGFIEMKTEEWSCREAISFNRDGFIGIAGWADKDNVKPIIEAMIEWCATIESSIKKVKQ